MRQRAGSSHRLLDPVLLPLLSQPHSTALPSPKRYDKRYEETVPKRIFARTTNHEDMVVTEDVEVGDTSLLTRFSIDGEYTSNTL